MFLMFPWESTGSDNNPPLGQNTFGPKHVVSFSVDPVHSKKPTEPATPASRPGPRAVEEDGRHTVIIRTPKRTERDTF